MSAGHGVLGAAPGSGSQISHNWGICSVLDLFIVLLGDKHAQCHLILRSAILSWGRGGVSLVRRALQGAGGAAGGLRVLPHFVRDERAGA